MEPTASLPVLLRDLERALGHTPEAHTARRVLVLNLAGYDDAEIRYRLSLTRDEFHVANLVLQDAAATVVEC